MEAGISDSSRQSSAEKISPSSETIPGKSLYKVVSPLGEQAPGLDTGKSSSGPDVRDLHGKKIGMVWAAFTNGNVLLESFMDLLPERFDGIDFIKIPSGENLSWGDHPDVSIGKVAKEAGVDAAIISVGG